MNPPYTASCHERSDDATIPAGSTSDTDFSESTINPTTLFVLTLIGFGVKSSRVVPYATASILLLTSRLDFVLYTSSFLACRLPVFPSLHIVAQSVTGSAIRAYFHKKDSVLVVGTEYHYSIFPIACFISFSVLSVDVFPSYLRVFLLRLKPLIQGTLQYPHDHFGWPMTTLILRWN